MQRLRLPRSFATARTGSVSIIAALSAVVLLGVAALAIDAGQFFLVKRRLQAATDIAAVVAASDLDDAEAGAAANVVANGFPASSLVAVERGVYVGDAAVPPDQRFTPGASAAANAVRISTATTTPMIFGRAVATTNSGEVSAKARAIGIVGDAAAFSIGSRLAELDGGVLNDALGALLGSRVTLAVADYRALADARIDAFGTSKAVAATIGLGSNARYADLEAADVKLADVLKAMAANAASGAAAVLRQLADQSGATRPFRFGSLIAFGPFANRPIGSTAPFAVEAGAFDLLFGAAEVSDAGRVLQVTLTGKVTGVLDARLALAIGQPAAGSSVVAVGQRGATLHTAQVRMLFSLRLAAAAPLTIVSLPIYLELAPATARLATIGCNRKDPTADMVDLGVTPGLAEGWIGTVPVDQLLSTAPQDPGPATLASLATGMVTVTGRAHASIANTRETLVRFTADDVAAGRDKTVTTTDFTSSLLQSLLSGLRLQVNAVGLGVGAPDGLGSTVAATLGAASPSIDQILAGTLAAFGVTLGDADVAVRGLRCGQGLLAN